MRAIQLTLAVLALVALSIGGIPPQARAADGPAQLVADIRPGPASAFPAGSTPQLAPLGDRLFFVADDGKHGGELWVSDGTPAGTVFVKDINPGQANAFLHCRNTFFGGCYTEFQSVVFGQRLFFLVDDGAHGMELWATDGTAAGTAMLKDIAPGEDTPFAVTTCGPRGPFCDTALIPSLTLLGDQLFFVADDGSGRELWRSDSTPSGTVRVSDIAPGQAGSNPIDLTVVGDKLFFVANDGAHGAEIWKSDGTVGGTTLLKDIRPGSDSPFALTSCPGFCTTSWVKSLTPVGERLLFFANDGVYGMELWASDGTTGGTALLKDIRPGQDSSVLRIECQHENYLCSTYFLATLAVLGQTLIFSADDGQTGLEPWRSDGTPQGTLLLGDLAPGADQSDPEAPTRVGSRLFFTAVGGGLGRELWLTDGTSSGTRLVADINPGESYSDPHPLSVFGDRLFFAARDDIHGNEPWISDGTAAGTALVEDINPATTPNSMGLAGSGPDGHLLFVGSDPDHGSELWTLPFAALNLFAPVARPGAALTTRDTSVSGALSADDADESTLTFALRSNGRKGTVTITDTATGAFTYTPNPGATGADTFTFTVSDGTFTSAPATVVVLIDPKQLFVPVIAHG